MWANLSAPRGADLQAATAARVRSAANTSPGRKKIFIRAHTPFCSMRGRRGLPKESVSFPRRRVRAAPFAIRRSNLLIRAGSGPAFAPTKVSRAKPAMAQPDHGCADTLELIGL